MNFLYHTKTTGIRFSINPGRRLDITAWIDSSFGVYQNGTGQTGCVITLGGGALYASSSKQRQVTTSSSECELYGLYDGSTAVIWCRDFLLEQGYALGPAVVHHDNTSAIQLAKTGYSSSKRSRHFHIKLFFLHDRIQRGEIELIHCPTEEMVADVLTKGLSGALFSKLASQLLNVHTDT